jgi:predicted lipoprotein with Yx(FWY)xxD motif
MRRSSWITAIIIILAILVGGGYALFHNPSTPKASNNSSNSTASQNKTPATTNSVFTIKTDPTIGQYLAGPTGKALYTYNADTSGVSNCTGSCLDNWPPYTVTSTIANLPAGISTIKRTDNGQMQYTYNGKPLYYFTGDSAGKVTGNGVENFSVAKPSSSSQSTTPSSNTSSQNSSSSGNPY